MELVEVIKPVWHTKIFTSYCYSLIYSMPNRIVAMIKSKGSDTKYWLYLNSFIVETNIKR